MDKDDMKYRDYTKYTDVIQYRVDKDDTKYTLDSDAFIT